MDITSKWILVGLIAAGCGDNSSVGSAAFTTTFASSESSGGATPTTGGSGTTRVETSGTGANDGDSGPCGGSCECEGGESRACDPPNSGCTGQQICAGGVWGACESQQCVVCGDGICDAGETQNDCCVDCGCGAQELCAGTCVCAEGLSDCGEGCVDVASDAAHCGGCGQACAVGELCASGQCQLDCGGLDQCGDSCVDLSMSEVHCGACGTACGATEVCSSGTCQCQPTDPGDEACDGLDNDCDGQVDEDPACVVCVPLEDFVLFPLNPTKGDTDFGGHGPIVDVSVTVSRSAGSIIADACVSMMETQADWTTGEKCLQHIEFFDNTSLVDTGTFKVSYLDTDQGWDDALENPLSLTDAPWMSAVKCVGDTPGGDVCSNKPVPDCSTCELDLGCINVRKPPP